MIIDILKNRKIEINIPFAKPIENDEWNIDFDPVNTVVKDLKKAKENIMAIQELRKNFKNSNDQSESTKMYKMCQEKHDRTDKLIKNAKKYLEFGRENLEG